MVDATQQQRANRAFGRSLADFQDQPTASKLLPAEDKLLLATARGERCQIGVSCPEAASADNRIRAGFLRFLLLGGDAEASVHEKGIQLLGAFIDGAIDLYGAKQICPVWLWACRLNGDMIARNASFGALLLEECRTSLLNCENVTVSGNVALVRCVVEGEVNFACADIGGQLNCTGSTFHNPKGQALVAHSSKIGDGLFLSGEFNAYGQVNLIGAEIGRQLSCINGRLNNPGGIALIASSAVISGNVFLSEGFAAFGEVNFTSAKVAQQFNCIKGSFNNPGAMALIVNSTGIESNVFLSQGFSADGGVSFVNADVGGDFVCAGGRFRNVFAAALIDDDKVYIAGDALSIVKTSIKGTLWLAPTGSTQDEVVIEGSLSLQDTYTHVFIDTVKSWPPLTVATEKHGVVRCIIALDGFAYDRFAGFAPTDHTTRFAWLMRQTKHHLKTSFRPQPFEQLMKVLRTMGHASESRQIGFYKETLANPVSVSRTSGWARPFVWAVGKFWGLLCGYGYRPHRIMVALILLWLFCGSVYHVAADKGVFAPSDAQVWAEIKDDHCSENWVRCERVQKVLVFNAWTYSLDVLLPVVELKQRTVWSPMLKSYEMTLAAGTLQVPAGFTRALTWAETLLGSLGIFLYGALISGLLKRD